MISKLTLIFYMIVYAFVVIFTLSLPILIYKYYNQVQDGE